MTIRTKSMVHRLYDRLRINETGTVAVIFALCAPALVIAAGIAVDYINFTRHRSELQAAADAAAVAGARESLLADTSAGQIRSVAESFAASNLDRPSRVSGPVDVTVAVEDDGSSVNVAIERKWKPYFAHVLDVDITPIRTEATASLISAGKVCVIGMQETLVAAVHLDDSARLTANGCGVYANSTSSWSLRVDANASLAAEWICTVGGYGGTGNAKTDPEPTIDCPAIPNPLSERLTPPDLGCDYFATVVVKNTTLSPGTYCGGLIVSGSAKAKLKPGTYIIKGGPLLVQGGAELKGKDVGFFLADELALFEFLPDTSIDLSAPETGPLAGLLFFENPKNSLTATPRVHIITSNDARRLIGTFYLPRSILQVDAISPVADKSAYTAIVALRLWLREGPNLVLNSDYASTRVPVPEGLVGRRIVVEK